MSLFSRHVEIYDFVRGSGHWRYTSADRAIVHLAQTYQPVAIKRGCIAQSAEEGKTALEITAPLSLELLDQWRPFPPTERVTLQLSRVRKSDDAVFSAWSGVISDIDEGQHTATIRCQTHMAAMGGNGLRRCWQISCPHVLYGPGCLVSQAAFSVLATLSSATATTVSSGAFAAHPDGWFAGGFIRWQKGAHTEHRFVTNHVGDTLTLLTPSALAGGSIVTALPGCDHSIATCDAKFGNAPNYGGQHTIPVKNPFGNEPVF